MWALLGLGEVYWPHAQHRVRVNLHLQWYLHLLD
jgi:hypothetical protein